jgi:hypothetical protein
MRLERNRTSWTALATLVWALPTHGHHSASMFDDTRIIELAGTVKELQWTNPHIWLQVLVPGEQGTVEWSIEGGSPNSLSRQGWRSTTFKPGDAVIVRINPMKDGSPAGNFVAAKLVAEDRTVGRWE